MFKKGLFFSVILLSGLLLTSANHKFYVSITQVDVNMESRKFEISSRIFTDDLEATILDETGQKLWLGTDKEHLNADSILFDYIASVLYFNQDGIDMQLNFIGKEVEADVTWIYLESEKGVSLEKAIDISNEILYDHFPDQKNIVNVRFDKKTVSQIHTKSRSQYLYSFN